jgi:hypothetical protein
MRAKMKMNDGAMDKVVVRVGNLTNKGSGTKKNGDSWHLHVFRAVVNGEEQELATFSDRIEEAAGCEVEGTVRQEIKLGKDGKEHCNYKFTADETSLLDAIERKMKESEAAAKRAEEAAAKAVKEGAPMAVLAATEAGLLPSRMSILLDWRGEVSKSVNSLVTTGVIKTASDVVRAYRQISFGVVQMVVDIYAGVEPQVDDDVEPGDIDAGPMPDDACSDAEWEAHLDEEAK